MIFVLKSTLNDEIVSYNFIFAFNYKNENQPPDIKDEFYRVICQTKYARRLRFRGGFAELYRRLLPRMGDI